MQISDLYEKSTMGEKLKDCFTELIGNNNINQTLRNLSLYDNGKLRKKNMSFMITLRNITATHRILTNLVDVWVSSLGQNLINNRDKSDDEVIDMTVQECTSVKLEEILSCSDFINVFNGPESDIKNQLQNLLNNLTEMNYDDIKKVVDASLLSSKDKKIFFAKVLPAYNFKVCNDFKATWDMFENGHIDFDTLVTKFWTRNDFDKDQNNTGQQNAFQCFASEYTKHDSYHSDNIANLETSAENMINGLRKKDVIANKDTQNLKDQLKDQIDNAADVGIFGIIFQFLSNLFSKDKTAVKPIQQIKQDRVISNLKPLSGILKQAAGRNKDNDKLI